MFEKRTRIVLACLVAGCLALLVRAGQLQIGQAGQWSDVAAEALRRTTLTETTRGRILDARGEVLAHDVPCNDAAVAYWFVKQPVNPDRLRRLARDLARQTPGYYQAETAEQIQRVEDQLPAAKEALAAFWHTLATVDEVDEAEVAQARDTIMQRIVQRRNDVVYRRFQRAVEEHEEGELSPWWRRWLLGDADAPPEMQQFEEPIADEEQAHVILRDLTNEQYNALLKYATTLPPTLREALVLRASRTRRYPYGPVSAQVIGRIAEVAADDIADDPDLANERRRYLPGDLIGRQGLEAMAERQLRGDRGRLDHDLELDQTSVAHEPAPGRDVISTLDVALSRDIAEAFNHVDFKWPTEPGVTAEQLIETGPMLGSAVVIDVRTGGVLAMVSVPSFDPNRFKEIYHELQIDEVNRPLLNRATQFAAVPGSTVKPLVGLAGVTDGVVGATEPIHCDGYFHATIPGRGTIDYTNAYRCWTASMFGNYAGAQQHQGGNDPHPTAALHPWGVPAVGDITLADALQRSCNVYFHNVATRLTLPTLGDWFERFGLGQPTGIGLPEQRGLVPSDIPATELAKGWYMPWRHAWWASIGQGYLQATPLQMANATATLARGGVAMRPTLLKDQALEATQNATDLKLNPAAVAEMRRGMWAVVHTAGGSGNRIDDRLPLEIAGKTGSAQAHLLTIKEVDDDGNVVRRPDGRPVYRRLRDLGTRGKPNPDAPWYRRNNLPHVDPAQDKVAVTHAWFIGFAPAEEPKYAFAVLVEYGGSGGVASGSVAAQVVQALVKHGYLTATRTPDPNAAAGEVRYLVD